MNNSSRYIATPLQDHLMQSSSGTNEKDSNSAECSPREKCESSQRRCYEGVSDQPVRRSLRFADWRNETSLLSGVDSKTALEMSKYDYTSSRGESSLANRLLSNQIHTRNSQQADMYPQPASFPGQSSLIIKSNQEYSLSDADTSTIIFTSRNELLPNRGDFNVSHCSFHRIISHGGSIASSSRAESSLYRLWLSRGLNDVIRSSQMALGYTSNNGNRAPQVNQDYSVLENGYRNEVDLLRQYFEQSLLFVQMIGSRSSEGSLAYRITTAQNGRRHEQGILFLGQSPLLNIVNLRDRFEDMRLDVENMSYEELLDLEDRIGNVSTGLSDEIIDKVLEHRRYFLLLEENSKKEFCSICQEDYVEENELGILNCGHEFHQACIKQWLKCKNVCPVCKSTGLTTSDPNITTNT